MLLGGASDSSMRYRISDANVFDTSVISFPQNSSRRIETAQTGSSGHDFHQSHRQINSSSSPDEFESKKNSSILSSTTSEYHSASEGPIFDITSPSNEDAKLPKGEGHENKTPWAAYKSENSVVPGSNMLYPVASKSSGERFEESLNSTRYLVPESSRSRSNAVIESEAPILKK